MMATRYSRALPYHVLCESDLQDFPLPPVDDSPTDQKKILVTGCFDWLHTGHVRFSEETAQLGDLYVVVGSDANVRLLKGAHHPLFPEALRCYMVASMRTVKQALISTGPGWMDAEPEIERIRPDA